MNEIQQYPKIADHVSHTLIDGEGVLLNQKTGKYLGLNAVGTRIFEMLQSGCTPDQIASQLSDRYKVGEELIRRDMQKFLDDAIRHDIVVFSPTSPKPLPTPPAPPQPVISNEAPQDISAGPLLVIHAYLLLFIIDCRLKFTKFDAVLKWLNAAKSRKSTSENDSAARHRVLIARVCRAVETSTKFYYRNQKDCLPNAILACYLMKKLGVPVKFCIGVTKFPFKAHAWVEYEEQVVFTTPANLWKYRAIMQL